MSVVQYCPWLPIGGPDREYFQRFLSLGIRFHNDGVAADELNSWKEDQLRNVVSSAARKSSFYKSKLDGISPKDISLNSVASLPFTTKEDLRDGMLEILSGGVRDCLYYFQTTGTTGISTPCPRDVKESLVSNFNVAMSLKKIVDSVCNEKPLVAVLIPNELHSACKTITDICKDLDIGVFDAWPGSPVVGYKSVVELFASLQVEIVVAPPALMLGIAKVAKKMGLCPKKDLNVKALLSTGEICSDAMKANVKSIIGCDTFDFIYGSQEAYVIAASDETGCLVPHLTNYIVEILEPDTLESKSVGEGELCITHLVPGLKPLIRYRTGDLVRLSYDQRHLSSRSSRIEVLGRIRDSIIVGAESITASEMESIALADLADCTSYQYILSTDNDTSEDRVQLNLEFIDEHSLVMNRNRNLPASLEAALTKRLGVTCEVLLHERIDPSSGTGSWVSWKASRVVDQRRNVGVKSDQDEFESKAARKFSADVSSRRRFTGGN